MSEVYANGREVSAKEDSNQSMGAMPDVCLSPPSPPAGPIPVPYPNFAVGSDTSDGTKTVVIGGKEVGIKNSSDYKQSQGNEAATRSFGMNVISHTISGKMRHAAWSMDVKFEGENAIRQLDFTTHNHANPAGGAAIVNGGKFKKVARETSCEKLDEANREAQSEKRPVAENVGEGRTVATAQYNPPAGAGMQISSSSHMSQFDNKDGWAHGNHESDGSYKPTKMCKGAKDALAPRYSEEGLGKNQSPMCHAESRIVETLFSQVGSSPGGSLTLRIQWHPTGKKRKRSDPCPKCEEMLCAVQKHCGIKIRICSGKTGEPEDLVC
jgi:hypothetical protein